MRVTKTVTALLLVAVISLLAGCGASSTSATSDTSSTSSDSSTTTSESSASTSGFTPTTIRISSSVAETHATYKALETFKAQVEEKTDGAVTVELYANSVLGSEDSVITQLQSSALDAAVVGGLSYFSYQAPIANVEEVPFLFSSYADAANAYNGEFGSYLASVAFEPFDIHVVDYWVNGFRHFTNSVRPIVTPADMAGIKFRSAPVDLRLLTFETLGASAISVNFNELFTALQQKTVDGQENPLSVIESQQFYDVQSYLSLSGHIYNASPFVFSQISWDSYSDELKAVINDAAAVAQAQQYEEVTTSEDAIVENLKSKGMQVNEIDYEAFRTAVEPVWENFIQMYGDEATKLLSLAKGE